MEGLRIGVSGGEYAFAHDLKMGNTSIMAELEVEGSFILGSVEFTYDNFIFAGEYKVQNTKTSAELFGGELSDTDMEESYVMVSYRFTDWFELGTYYSVSGDEDKTKDWALSGRFDLADNWTFKLEGHLLDGDSILMDDTNPGGTDDDWFMLMAKMTFSF